MYDSSLSFKSSYIFEENDSSLFELRTFKRYKKCEGDDVIYIGEYNKLRNWPPQSTKNGIFFFKSEFNQIIPRFEMLEPFTVKFENGSRVFSFNPIEGSSYFEIKLYEDAPKETMQISAQALKNIFGQIDAINKDLEKDEEENNLRIHFII